MASPKEKKQTAVLVAILCGVVVVILLSGIPNLPNSYSFFGLLHEKGQAEMKLDAIVTNIANYRRGLASEKLDKEQSARDAQALAWMESQVQGLEPQFWFLRIFEDDGQKLFGIRTSKTGRIESKPTPDGMRLPQKEIFSYRVTVDGSFNEIGKFVAHLENKYPLLAVRSISLKSSGPESGNCTAEIVFRILKKSDEIPR